MPAEHHTHSPEYQNNSPHEVAEAMDVLHGGDACAVHHQGAYLIIADGTSSSVDHGAGISRTVVDALQTLFDSQYNSAQLPAYKDLQACITQFFDQNTLNNFLEQAHLSQNRHSTTLSLALRCSFNSSEGYLIFSVGDSPVYKIHADSSVSRLTVDHAQHIEPLKQLTGLKPLEVQIILDEHSICDPAALASALSIDTQEKLTQLRDILLHRQLTQAIYHGSDQIPTQTEFVEILPGESLLLATDGLNIPPSKMSAILTENPQDLPQALQAMIQESPKLDDVTVIAYKYTPDV